MVDSTRDPMAPHAVMDAIVDGVTSAIEGVERKWGHDRLGLLVSDDLRARWVPPGRRLLEDGRREAETEARAQAEGIKRGLKCW